MRGKNQKVLEQHQFSSKRHFDHTNAKKGTPKLLICSFAISNLIIYSKLVRKRKEQLGVTGYIYYFCSPSANTHLNCCFNFTLYSISEDMLAYASVMRCRMSCNVVGEASYTFSLRKKSECVRSRNHQCLSK